MPSSLEALSRTVAGADQGLPSAQAIHQFAAPNVKSFLRHYERTQARANAAAPGCVPGRLPFVPSWHWPAFLVTVPWMFYRKMYSGGIILVALPVFLDHILPGSLFLGSGLAIAVTAGICGKTWYLEHAVRRMAKARRAHDTDGAREGAVRIRGRATAGQHVRRAIGIIGNQPAQAKQLAAAEHGLRRHSGF